MVVFCLGFTQPPAFAQEIPKARLQPIVAMAMCQTVVRVKANYARVPKPEIAARFVYYSKLLELMPKDREAAKGLINTLPRDEKQANRLSMLGGSLYLGETGNEIGMIARYAHGSEVLWNPGKSPPTISRRVTALRDLRAACHMAASLRSCIFADCGGGVFAFRSQALPFQSAAIP